MSEDAPTSGVRTFTGRAAVLGFLTVFFGVLSLGSPFVAGVVVVVAVGFSMLAGGIAGGVRQIDAENDSTAK